MAVKVECAVLGILQTNCYLVKNEQNRECVLVDPAGQFERIQKMVESSGCKLQGILLTHGHFDHIMAASEAKRHFGVKIYAGKHEQKILAQPALNLSGDYLSDPVELCADEWLDDGQGLELAHLVFRVIHTPGHTCGGVCYYLPDEGILFSGDTLFAESVGRTDFPTGSMSELVRSIQEKLFVLPEETAVYTGHGECTAVAYEKQYNPYCR